MAKRKNISSNKSESHYVRQGENGHLISKKSDSTGEIDTKNNGAKSDNPELSVDEKLMNLRQKIVESGRPLLTWDEINEEVARRRGGFN